MKFLGYIFLCFSCVLIAQSKENSNTKVKADSSWRGCFSPEEIAKYPSGYIEMNKFIKQNFIYPQRAKEEGVEGKCYVSFVIDTMGKIKDIKVVKGIKGCVECDEEAKRLISIMPNWKPTSVNGKKQECKINYPVKFQMM